MTDLVPTMSELWGFTLGAGDWRGDIGDWRDLATFQSLASLACQTSLSGRSNWTTRQIAGPLLLAERTQKLRPNMLLIQGADFFLIDLNLGLRNKTSQ